MSFACLMSDGKAAARTDKLGNVHIQAHQCPFNSHFVICSVVTDIQFYNGPRHLFLIKRTGTIDTITRGVALLTELYQVLIRGTFLEGLTLAIRN